LLTPKEEEAPVSGMAPGEKASVASVGAAAMNAAHANAVAADSGSDGTPAPAAAEPITPGPRWGGGAGAGAGAGAPLIGTSPARTVTDNNAERAIAITKRFIF